MITQIEKMEILESINVTNILKNQVSNYFNSINYRESIFTEYQINKTLKAGELFYVACLQIYVTGDIEGLNMRAGRKRP